MKRDTCTTFRLDPNAWLHTLTKCIACVGNMSMRHLEMNMLADVGRTRTGTSVIDNSKLL